jgi:hypothetical protein
MYGIPAIVDDQDDVGDGEGVAAAAGEFVSGSDNFGGINRATNVFWRAQRIHNSGTLRELSNGILQQGWLQAINVGGADPNMLRMWCDPSVFATIGLMLIGDRRIGDSTTLNGGFLEANYNGTPINTDRDCPRNTLFILDMDSILFLTQNGYEFLNEDGNIIRNVADRDAWEFTINRDAQIGARNCKKHVRIEDIQTAFNMGVK